MQGIRVSARNSLFLDSPGRGLYTGRVTPERFRELSSAIVACAAQLVYTGNTADSYRLLSAADRLFRSFADPGFGGPSPLADELTLAVSFLELVRILLRLEIDLVVDLDEETRSASFVNGGSLVDAMDQIVTARASMAGPVRIALIEEGDKGGRGLLLVAGDARVPI
jgi:hypothetical protein